MDAELVRQIIRWSFVASWFLLVIGVMAHLYFIQKAVSHISVGINTMSTRLGRILERLRGDLDGDVDNQDPGE